MKITISLILTISLLIGGCSMENKINKWKEEIRQTEQAFAEMVATEGLHKAFIHFAADDAVLLRNDDLIIGKDAIDTAYQGHNARGLSWEPDFIYVSDSGELAYTYGHYTYTYDNENGNEQQDNGIFHTIWKRQPDGSWKFVWD